MCDLALALDPSSRGLAGWSCLSDYHVCLNGSSTWNGVTCSISNKITSIEISGLALYGTIPSTVGVLSDLTKFDFSYNDISGTIPSSISKLVSLQYLDLSENYFTGPLPSAMDNFGSLEYFSVTKNLLTGTIPYALCLVKALSYLYLDSNQFVCYFDCRTTVTTHNFGTVLSKCNLGELLF